MRLRQLVLACGLASLALSSHVSALGLGEVKLKSTLNQPLEAEVKLLDTRDLTAEQILVTLASPADFERNGVDRLFFYTEFQFAVDLESPDGPKVLITSRNPVREPYLNFLIEARWTAGRLLREYTLLMDLPTFEEDGAARAVQSATTTVPKAASRPAATTEVSANQPTTARTSSGSGAVSRKPALSGKEYEVRGNDTLWEIALRARPDSSVSVHQSMMALYKANPEAFISGNINRLRRGQVLRVPDAEEMKSLGKSEAISQFAAASGDSGLGAQINASRRTSTTRSESTEVSGRVKLAAPSASGGKGQGSGANDGSGKALESELATTLEELDKSKAENTELSSRVKDLEAQIETMQRLVDVSNEKLRALQVAAEQKPADASAQLTAPTEAVGAPTQEPPVQEVAPVEPVAAASTAASSAPAVVAPQPVAPPKVVTPPPSAPTLVDTAIENAPWIGLGVLGLAGAGYFAYRRRKQQAEEQQTFEQEDVFAMDEAPGDMDEPVDAPNNLHEIDETSLFDEEQPASAEAETGDVVGEADIYIAYGKLDQAEEMLLNALKKDPDSADIRMKLLEVYAQQQNASGFDKQYAALLPIAGAALLSRASELRAGISGAGEFDSGVATAASEPIDDFSLDDFSLDDDLSVSEAEPQVAAVSGGFEPGDFDFKLDLDDEEPKAASIDLADDFALDLDDSPVAKDADDLSELSLALDGLTENELPEDVEAASASIEEEFNFDLNEDLALDGDLALEEEFALDEDLALDDDLPVADGVVSKVEQPFAEGGASTESLDVAADDFNLDMNVDDIDLAALDHEMESLDVDFDDEALETDQASISEFVAQEIAKDQADLELDLDEDMELDDLSPSNLNLTDDLDSSAAAISFELEDDTSFDGELEADFSADSDFTVADESDAAITEMLDLAEDSNDASDVPESAFNVAGFESDESLVDLDAAFGGPISGAEEALPEVDLELGDELPASFGAVVTEEPFGVADSGAFEPSSEFDVPVEEQHDEDLFSQALSEFSSESDDLDLNEFTSDETALADLSDDDMDSELDFLADADEAATKLDLARAYIDMGDTEGAKDILSEVINEGNDEQRNEANELLGRIV